MGKAPVLIKINSNKNRFLLLQSFPVCRGIFPRHILKEAAESTHTFKAQNHRYLFDACCARYAATAVSLRSPLVLV